MAARPVPLRDERGESERDHDVVPVQLLESEEYLYQLRLDDSDQSVRLAPDEFFYPDDDSGLRGRLRPGLHTGTVHVEVTSDTETIGRVELEVRSRKLDYLSHYRWMLRDITEDMTELVMRRFAPTEQRFTIDEALDAPTLYQRFAFLKSLLQGDVFGGAIQHILRRPHRTWMEEEEMRRPGEGIRTTSEVVRQMGRPGPRVSSGHLGKNLGMETLPRKVRVSRHEETLDNPPNRFVQFALERWRDVVAQIRNNLSEENVESAPVKRGLNETSDILNRLDAYLAHEIFRETGRLTQFPAGNQVLQKREGYREIFRAYVQFEAAAQLSWKGGEDVYGAGQRDVAVLYEYWVFYQLGNEIADLCDQSFAFDELIEEGDGGLHLRLKRGKRQVLSGSVRRLGRELAVEFWFNRSFSSARGETWTRMMRPDCSLCIRPLNADPSFFYEEVWLHFDAKYRLDRLEEALGDPEGGDVQPDDEDAAETSATIEGQAKREDLLRMHAYRDAIHRSSGAYVVYPGSDGQTWREYHEILPGLGAFALQPTADVRGKGINSIRRFIDKILDHVATQTSQHERARYWMRESYRDKPVPEPVPAASFLDRPPADTQVLLGYVKNEAHREWIRREGLYNLRADEERAGSVSLDADELSADLLLLYGRSLSLAELWTLEGAPQVFTRDRMLESGYPAPNGQQYFCLRLGHELTSTMATSVSSKQIARLHRRVDDGPIGRPIALSWLELMEIAREPNSS